MSGKMKRLKIKMEVQEITFNYFARPQPRDLNFYAMMMMAIQNILLSVVSKFVVGVCDGLDACEISRPEILSQSAPVCGNNDGNIIHEFKNCISISVATVLEVSKMTVYPYVQVIGVW